MNENKATSKASPTNVKNFVFGSPVEARDFDEFLDRLETKYDATIVLLATIDSPDHNLKMSSFTEDWFFSEYYERNGLIVLDKQVGDLMSGHVLSKRENDSDYFRYNLSSIACTVSMRLSPNGMAFDPEKTPPKQVARECLAECLAFLWETCTSHDGNLKVVEESDDIEEALETMGDNWKDILKYSDYDLGIKLGTRKDVVAFVEHWTEYVSGGLSDEEEEDEEDEKKKEEPNKTNDNGNDNI